MNKGIEQERIKVVFNLTQETEEMSIDNLNIKDGTRNALKRLGIFTVGDILNYWSVLRNLIPKEGKSGIGVTKEKEIHASVFAYLCDSGCVKKLQFTTDKVVRG